MLLVFREKYVLPCLFFALFFVALGLSPAASQAQDVRTITFDEAVSIALQENTTLKRAGSAVRRQEINVSRERMDFFPDLRLSVDGTRRYGRGFSQEEGGIVNETNEFFRLNASSSVNLFNGFGDVASLQRAQLENAAGDQRYERTRQDVVFNVMDRFIALIESRELVQVREEEQAYQQEQLERTRELVEAGSRPESELFQQEANVAEAELAVLNAERDYEINRTRLMQVLQLDPLGGYEFEAPSLNETPLTPAAYDLHELLERAFERRADLDARQLDLQAAEQGVRVARSGYYPRLDLSAGYGSDWSSAARQPVSGTGTDPEVVTVPQMDGSPLQLPVPGTGAEPEFQQPPFFDQLDDRRGGSIGLSLSIPIFDRLAAKNSVEDAKVQLQDARYELEDLRQEITLEVRQAYLDYQTAQKALDATEKRLRAAERARDAAQERYELGAAPYVELLQANRDYVSAASEHIRARYDYIYRQKLIDYYLGVLDPSASPFK